MAAGMVLPQALLQTIQHRLKLQDSTNSKVVQHRHELWDDSMRGKVVLYHAQFGMFFVLFV
jgi:hypothetical protein